MKVEYQIIKRKDNFCNDENQFISLLETNQNYKIIREECILKYKELKIAYDIKKYETKEKNEIMLVITFLVEDEAKIEELEKFDKSFLDFLSKFNDFSLNILWDDISIKYAESMYSQISYIENLLRKIIYYFMGKNVGNNWTRKCFPELVDNSIKKVKDKNHIETDENILYYADFIQLNFLLFVKYSNETISQSELIEKLKDEKCDIEELISKYEGKSNWDRYFQPVVNKENLENDLNKLYYYRNLVAHNRKIRKHDKTETELLVTKIKKVLNACLSRIDKINVPEEEKENLENMSCQIFNPITYEIGSNLSFTPVNIGINTPMSSFLDNMRNVNLEINTANTLLTDSIKTMNIGVNTAMTSFLDNMRNVNFGINSDSALLTNNIKPMNIGTNVAMTSFLDNMRNANLEINPANTLLTDNIKPMNIETNTEVSSFADNMGIINSKINPVITPTLTASKNKKGENISEMKNIKNDKSEN